MFRPLERGFKLDVLSVISDQPVSTLMWSFNSERLNLYEVQTRPVIEFFADRGLLHTVDAIGTVGEVSDWIN